MKFIKDNKGLFLFIGLMIVFRSSIADWNPVPTGSMLPTIVEGDVIFVNKLAYDIKVPLTDYSLLNTAPVKRGDIVVFKSKRANLRLVKRIIGLPGDTIAMFNNQLYINGSPLDYKLNHSEGTKQTITELLPDKAHAIQLVGRRSRMDSFPATIIPAEHYFAMGDNRQNSVDSRVYGFIPHSELVGRTERVLLSFNLDNHYLPRKERFLHGLD
ncbi:MAG: signal peptidase I [Arenicella sp.]